MFPTLDRRPRRADIGSVRNGLVLTRRARVRRFGCDFEKISRRKFGFDRMRVPTDEQEVIDLTASTSTRQIPTGNQSQHLHPSQHAQEGHRSQVELGHDVPRHGPHGGSGKRKFPHVEEEQRVIGRLKRVHLMEGGATDVSDEVVILEDGMEGPDRRMDGLREGEPVREVMAPRDAAPHAPYGPPAVYGQEDGRVGAWDLGDVGDSLYTDVNRMLGEAHRERVARKKRTL